MTLTPYDQDFYSWALEQAELLRSRRFEQVDWANVVEELADLGRSEYRALVSALEQLTLHLLKWQYQPRRRSRSWQLSMDKQRIQVERLLEENPGLRGRLEEAIAAGYKYGRKGAAKETTLPESTFPALCPYDWALLLQDGWYPEVD